MHTLTHAHMGIHTYQQATLHFLIPHPPPPPTSLGPITVFNATLLQISLETLLPTNKALLCPLRETEVACIPRIRSGVSSPDHVLTMFENRPGYPERRTGMRDMFVVTGRETKLTQLGNSSASYCRCQFLVLFSTFIVLSLHVSCWCWYCYLSLPVVGIVVVMLLVLSLSAVDIVVDRCRCQLLAALSLSVVAGVVTSCRHCRCQMSLSAVCVVVDSCRRLILFFVVMRLCCCWQMSLSVVHIVVDRCRCQSFILSLIDVVSYWYCCC